MKRPTKNLLVACLFLATAVGLAGFYAVAGKSGHPAASAHGAIQARGVNSIQHAAPAGLAAGVGGNGGVAEGLTPELAAAARRQAREAAMERLHNAATTYDAAQLVVIEPYLVDSDPELRAAAIDSMIILGDAAAVPMLRQAAKQVQAPAEVLALEKAADYLELPPVDVTQLLKMRKKKSHPVPRNLPTPRP